MNIEKKISFLILAIAALITTTFILMTAGQHPETLLYESVTLILFGEIVGFISISVILSYLLRKFVHARIHFSATLTIMSLLFAFALLIELTTAGKLFSVSVDDSLWLLTVFFMASSLAGGFVLAGNNRGMGWMIISFAAIAQFAYFVFLLLATAMAHWH
jgi:hypothetical protein